MKRLTLLRSKTNSSILIVCLLVLLVGFFLRSRMIINGDFWFTPDQARDMLLARDVVVSHKPILIGARSGIEGIFHGPLWIYMVSIPFALSGGDPQKVSWLFLVVSFAVVLGMSWVAYKLYNKWIAFLVLVVLSFSQGLYTVINDTTNAHGLPLVMIGFLYSLILFIRGNKKAFLITIFFAGLAFEFQAAFAIFLLPYTILLALLIDRSIFTLKNIGLGIGVYALSLISLILFELRHHFLTTKAVIQIFTHPGGLQPIKGYEQYSNIFFRIHDRLQTLINTPYLILPTYNFFLYLLAVGIILSAGVILFRTRKNNEFRKEYALLFLFPVFVYVLYILYPLPVWTHYTFAMPVIIALLFALSCFIVWPYQLGKLTIILFFLLVLPDVTSQLQSMYKQPYIPATDGSYRNQLSVADSILADAGGKPFSYFVYAPPVVTYGMDYLLWWQGNRKYHMIPSNQKQTGLMYIVLYPNAQDASAHQYFITHVLHTHAKLLSTKMFPGDIIVQKRLVTSNEQPVDPNYYAQIR